MRGTAGMSGLATVKSVVVAIGFGTPNGVPRMSLYEFEACALDAELALQEELLLDPLLRLLPGVAESSSLESLPLLSLGSESFLSFFFFLPLRFFFLSFFFFFFLSFLFLSPSPSLSPPSPPGGPAPPAPAAPLPAPALLSMLPYGVCPPAPSPASCPCMIAAVLLELPPLAWYAVKLVIGVSPGSCVGMAYFAANECAHNTGKSDIDDTERALAFYSGVLYGS